MFVATGLLLWLQIHGSTSVVDTDQRPVLPDCEKRLDEVQKLSELPLKVGVTEGKLNILHTE